MWLIAVLLLPDIVLPLSCFHVKGRVCVKSTHTFVFSNCTHGKVVLETFDLYAETHPSSYTGPLIGAESTCASLLSTQVRCWMMCVSLSAAGTGDALWIQRSPSAAPCWTTAHSGAGRGNYTGGWLQTLSAPLHCQVLTHSSAEAIPALGSFLELEKGTNEGFSLLLKDHDLQQYFPDVLALEREELL
uniref:Uncharacterized protein n=1 Tax=Anabas testudineus TaxID=64144 RepID=A0AAQ6I9H3_ANATE